MHPPDPPPPPPPGTRYASPARVAAGLHAALTRRGVTGMYTATAEKFALISVTAALTVWTNGDQIWCTHGGQRLTWPAAGIEEAAAQQAALAGQLQPPGAGPLGKLAQQLLVGRR
jgi:hypothetical protein